MDRLHIRNLRAQAILGVYPGERHRRQPVVVNLTVFVDTRPAAHSDDLADAVDYAAIARRVLDHLTASRATLIERLAQELADLILADFAVDRVIVRLDKPEALPGADGAGVEIDRRRPS